MKFCKDCRWCEKKDFIDQYDLKQINYACLKTKKEYAQSLVDGSKNYTMVDCWRYRGKTEYGHDECCGPEAKYFEPRKTFIERLKEWFK